MNKKPISTVNLLRIIGLLWNSYLLTLLILDRSFTAITPLPDTFFVLNFTASLGYLLVVLLPIRKQLIEAIPIFVLFIGIVPTLILIYVAPDIPVGATLHAEGMNLRLIPIQLLAMLLAAWQYAWWQVVLFAVLVSVPNYPFFHDMLNLMGIGDVSPPPPPAGRPQPPVNGRNIKFSVDILMSVIKTSIFLMVGLAMNYFVMQMKRYQAHIEQLNMRLRANASTLEQLTVSRERNRMARELHDTLTHTLSALTIQLETIKAYQDEDPNEAKKMLNQSIETARNGLGETRRALVDLRANPLEDLGLSLAIRALAEAVAEKEELTLDISIMKPIRPLPVDIEQALYRIAQEVLANVEHHAQAKTLTISLYEANNEINLKIADDGVGFDTRQPAEVGHYGLEGLYERVALVGGILTINSTPQNGTTILVEIPTYEDFNL